MPSPCRVKLPVSTDWFNPSIAHQAFMQVRGYF